MKAVSQSEDLDLATHGRARIRFPRIFLLVSLLLTGIAASSVLVHMNGETARIWDVEYLVRDDVLVVTVKITYSYSRERTLKITVETSNPASSHERTITVGPGTDTRAVDFELKPPPLQSTWYATFTLYERGEQGGKMEVLHMKNMDLNLDEARLRGKLSAGLVPLLFVFLSSAAITILLYLRRRKKKTPEKRKKKRR